MGFHGVECQYFDVMSQSYDVYIRMADGPARIALLGVIDAAEDLLTGLPLVGPTHSSEIPLFGVAAGMGRLALDIAQSSGRAEVQPTENFIQIFERGIDAFFSEGISTGDKARLFDLAMQASQKPAPSKADNEALYQARSDIIFALFGKRLTGMRSYQGVNIEDMFKTAAWLHGETHEVVHERGWSLDPKVILGQNLSLLRRSPEQLDKASTELADIAEVTQKDILEHAGRALYRYGHQAELMRHEIREMAEMGTLELVKKRPDILNYPVKVQLEVEDAYVSMGMDRTEVRKHAKLYVYKPETIKDRLHEIEKCIAAIDAHLDPTEIEKTVQEILSTPALLIEYGKARIMQRAQLVAQYASQSDWHEVVDNPHTNAADAPRRAALANVLRAKEADLKAALEAEPEVNIFIAARTIVNQNKTKRPSRHKSLPHDND